MLTLANPQKITATLDASYASQVICVATYIDIGNSGPSLQASVYNPTSDTTAVDVVPTPSSGSRQVKMISFYNSHSAAVTLTVYLAESGGNRILIRQLLGSGQTLQFTDREGFFFANSVRTHLSGTGAWRGPVGKALQLDVGTTAQRPTGADGMLRYNSDTPGFEGYSNSAWGAIGGSGGGDVNLDGGFANSTYTAAQSVDGGAAA